MNTMINNGATPPKCYSLCQSSKHAASLQSKITSTSDTVPFQIHKGCRFFSASNLALCDTEGIFRQNLKHHHSSHLTLVPF